MLESRMTFLARLLIVLPVCLASTSGYALQVDRLEITAEKNDYTIDMAFRVAATAENVVAVLTDFGYPDRLNPDVTSKEVLFERDGVTRIRIGFRGCVLFFCRATAMTQDIRIRGNEITADAVADGGDFKSGRLHWQVLRSGHDGAAVRFRATVEYEKYVLPFIGKFFVRKRLRQQLLRTAENLEVEASR